MIQIYVVEKLLSGLPVIGVSMPDTTDTSTWRIDFEPGASQEDIDTAQALVDGFDIAAWAAQQNANDEAATDAKIKWAASAIKDKTPTQIYTLVQGQIDGWSSLAEAKADLREWIPLLIAAVAWQVMRDVQEN